ncbi:hypothetical protein PanWU01x14_242530 [Parasponia andersonii]|uniref:Uncharacterized protein n=1 Tax=Parasponia andersonii TaxID=3476 RepID=A0A2P5BFZ9_PARAD|nr:hypothetical protein PanWU01x14_242530 [Parasponia andersonii]
MQSLASVWPASFLEHSKKRQEPPSQSLKRALIYPGNEIIGRHITSRVHHSNNSLESLSRTMYPLFKAKRIPSRRAISSTVKRHKRTIDSFIHSTTFHPRIISNNGSYASEP